jgi:HK97 family phage prohead protease
MSDQEHRGNYRDGNLEIRAARTVDVSFPDRTIEVITIPYDTPTMVEHEGRMITETVAPGAFDGIEKRPGRVRVNRDHLETRTVGHAAVFYAGRPEGLVAELRISDTELGNETLRLAADDCLDASAAFELRPGDQQWPTRNHRHITRAFLRHIGLVPDPAYPTARVLAVRNRIEAPDRTATPRLDAVRAELLAARYDALSR